jgi:hypothetical protein
VPERAELLSVADPRADDGVEIAFTRLQRALRPGNTGFLQYSVDEDTALTALHPAWTSVAAMVAIDETGVGYQPDPGDPGSQVSLPEVWDFSGLIEPNLTYRTFNSTRDDLTGNTCGDSCSVRDIGATPPDGTWQSYLKIDNYAPGGALYTRDLFNINDNDTGANPSIDVPYVVQDELNSSDRTQICFQQSAGGAERLLKFFQFTGADPASATLGVGDTWTSGAWTSCNNTSGLKLTVASQCGDACWPECSAAAEPRARGMLGAGAGFRATILEDGFVRVAAGNYVPTLLMRQDTDVEAGVNFFGTCNVGTTRLRAFDYFWVQEYYGLLALVSSPANSTMPADDWSSIGNVSDGADFTWGPYPPYQIQARACLAGTRLDWSLPADGSNLNGEPGVSDYGYVVSWGASADPEELAEWMLNPNRTPLPGEPGYLVAPAGLEPTSHIVTGWPGASINATVVTALRYTDPDVGDQRAYRSAAFFKVAEDPAQLDGLSFRVGLSVAPFVTKSGNDLTLAWPAVAGAAGYLLRVWDLDTDLEIACPAGLDCNPATPSAVHAGAVIDGEGYGYRAYAIDPCGAASVD